MESTEDTLRYIWDMMKTTTVSVTGVQRGEKENGIKIVFEKIMTKNFLKLEKDVNYDFQVW